MSESILIVGATSGIAVALARRFASAGARLVLAGRRIEELERLAADLRVRGAVAVVVEPFDALDVASHERLVARAFADAGSLLDGVVVAHGTLPDQAATEHDALLVRETIEANLTSTITVAHAAAARMDTQGRGWIVILSSVAGDRGRASNGTYGAAKAGVSAFASALRQRLLRRGVHVLTVKPGFVATAMTREKLDPSSPLVATPDRVARDIERALRRRRAVVYTPWFWRYILLVIRLLPERVFGRLRF